MEPDRVAVASREVDERLDPGVLHGLLRVRGFTQDDAHIFCTPEQLDEAEPEDQARFAVRPVVPLTTRTQLLELAAGQDHRIEPDGS